MATRRIAAYLILTVAVSTSAALSVFAQQPPEESLALSVNHGRVAESVSGRVFLVNPQFLTLNQSWDERFGEQFEVPDNFKMYLARMAGYERDPEVTLDEYLAELEATGRRLVLSAETLHIKEQAWLTLNNASNVNPKQGIIFDAANRGSLSLNLHVESGKRYDIQFFLEPLGPGIFEVFVGSDQQQYQDPAGKMKNILVSLKAMSSGWTRVELNRTFGVGFILRSVDIIATDDS